MLHLARNDWFFSDWVGRGQVLYNYYDARSWMKQKLNLNGVTLVRKANLKDSQFILWMEEILQHLGWLKPYSGINRINSQLVQDFFHPPFHHKRKLPRVLRRLKLPS